MSRAALDAVAWRDGIEVVSALPHWVTFRVSCHLLTADRLVRFMSEHQSAIPERERDLLMTAFRELLVNAMEHGAGFDPEKVVEVTAARTKRAIVYHFRDPGAGFDQADLKHATESADPELLMQTALRRAEQGMRPGGFGMLIVRRSGRGRVQRARQRGVCNSTSTISTKADGQGRRPSCSNDSNRTKGLAASPSAITSDRFGAESDS